MAAFKLCDSREIRLPWQPCNIKETLHNENLDIRIQSAISELRVICLYHVAYYWKAHVSIFKMTLLLWQVFIRELNDLVINAVASGAKCRKFSKISSKQDENLFFNHLYLAYWRYFHIIVHIESWSLYFPLEWYPICSICMCEDPAMLLWIQ